MNPLWWLVYPVVGAGIGFLAGLLGIGGGMTLVPVLVALFEIQNLSNDHVVHLALGTAMAGVVFTASSSVREHHRLGSVDWTIFKRLGPPMAAGTLLSSAVSGWVEQRHLALSFSAIVLFAAWQIWNGKKPAPHRTLPGTLWLWLAGLAMGVVCGLVSAGGTFLSMPFMLWCGVPVRTAIGTGAALGLPVAVLGTLGFITSGWSVTPLSEGYLGFVYLPALAGLVVASMLTAPAGARAAHRMPVQRLRRIFAVILLLIACKMLWAYL